MEHFLIKFELRISFFLLFIWAKEVKELVKTDGAAVVFIQDAAGSVKNFWDLSVVIFANLSYKALYADFLSLKVHDTQKDLVKVLTLLTLYCLEDILKYFATVTNPLGQFKILVPELDSLQDAETDRVNENQTAVNTSCINNEHLLVGLLQAEEVWLRIVKRLFVKMVDVIPAIIILADGDPRLRWTLALLNVPNLKYPVGIESVNASWLLAHNQVYYVVVFQWGSCAQIDSLQWLLSSSDVILVELVLGV